MLQLGVCFFCLLCILFLIKLGIIIIIYKWINRLVFPILYAITDFPIIILFLILILFSIFSQKFCFVSNIFLFFSCFHYFIDIVCINYFRSRALIPEIFSFCSLEYWKQYYKKILLLLLWFSLLFLLAYIISFIVVISYKFAILLIILFSISYISVLWILHLMHKKVKYLWNIYTLNSILRKSNGKSFGNYKNWNNKNTYKDYIVDEPWTWKDLNIILVFYESLSAIDSQILWWNNNTPLFDKIQKEWIIFKNFISNWTNSLWWHVSLFQWLLPYQYNSYQWFKNIVTPLPKFLYSMWYNTTFLSAMPLTFCNQRTYLKQIWFKNIIWEERFYDKEKYTQHAAPDYDLYNETIKEIKKQRWKYFIGLQTISFHNTFWNEYNTPYWTSQKSAIKYSDEMIYRFYDSLKKINFFDSWILIIIWDHRKQLQMEEWENIKLWKNRYTKSAATVVWKWITPNTNNNIIQHTDFLHSIKKLIWKWNVEIDKKYNDIFTNESNRNWWITMNPSQLHWIDMFTISNRNDSYSFNKISRQNIKQDEIYEYITSQLEFQIKHWNVIWKIEDTN